MHTVVTVGRIPLTLCGLVHRPPVATAAIANTNPHSSANASADTRANAETKANAKAKADAETQAAAAEAQATAAKAQTDEAAEAHDQGPHLGIGVTGFACARHVP